MTQSPFSFLPIDEAELHRVAQAGVRRAGRRSAHPGDRMMAVQLAAEVVQALRDADFVILKQLPQDRIDDGMIETSRPERAHDPEVRTVLRRSD